MESLFERIKRDFDWLEFRVGRKFAFRAPKTVFFEDYRGEKGLVKKCVQINNEDVLKNSVQKDTDFSEQLFYLSLFHEIGHAILKHQDFSTDPERLKMERAAWEEARILCSRYQIEYNIEYVEEKMDTYRDWLHSRSICAQCGLTRFQDTVGIYHCPRCEGILGNC